MWLCSLSEEKPEMAFVDKAHFHPLYIWHKPGISL
jgi:hypothetical protein